MAGKNVQIIIKSEQFVKDLKKFKEKNREAFSKGLMNAGFFLKAEIMKDIATEQWSRADGSIGPSVDTGRFLNSIATNRVSEVAVKVSSDVEYAEHLEFGTSAIRPRRHFRRSLERSKDKINKIMVTSK